jgi:hypothetical protein
MEIFTYEKNLFCEIGSHENSHAQLNDQSLLIFHACLSSDEVHRWQKHEEEDNEVEHI